MQQLCKDVVVFARSHKDKVVPGLIMEARIYSEDVGIKFPVDYGLVGNFQELIRNDLIVSQMPH